MALDYSIIGSRIRKARLEKNITQEELAEKIDVSVAFISRIERGTSHVNLKRLSQICNILNVTEGEILNGVSNNSEKYLNNEFNNLLRMCSPKQQKLIYNIIKVILDDIVYEINCTQEYVNSLKNIYNITGAYFIDSLTNLDTLKRILYRHSYELSAVYGNTEFKLTKKQYI